MSANYGLIVFDYFFQIFYASIPCWLSWKLLTPRKHLRHTLFINLVIYILCISVVFLVDPINTRSVFSKSIYIVTTFLSIRILYRDNISKIIAITTFILVTEISLDYIIYIFYLRFFLPPIIATPTPLQYTSNKIFILMGFFIAFFLFLLFIKLAAPIFDTILTHTNRKDLIYLFIFPISIFNSLLIITLPGQVNRSLLSYIFIFGIIIFYPITGYCFLKLYKNLILVQNKRQNNQLLLKAIELQCSHFDELYQEQLQIQKLNHDIKSHLFTIKILIQNNECQQADQYLQQLLTQTSQVSFVSGQQQKSME